MDLHAHFEDATRRDWQEATEGTVRFAMVGLGFWTRERAIPAAEAAEHCEPTVAVSGSPEKAENVASDCGPMNHVVSYDEFHDGAAADAYDAIYVATPNAYHLEYVETAVELGKAVLCEKPMEATVERAEAMVAAADRGDVPLMVAYRMQTEPAVRRMRELVARGFVGDPVHVHGHMSQLLLEMNPDPGQWRLDPELSGEGTSVMDLGVYPLNTTRYLLDADPVAVQSMQYSGHEAFEAVPDERSAFQVRFPSGVLASFSASQNAVISSRLAVTGTEGELALEPAFFDDRPRRVTLSRDGTRAEVEVEPVDQMEEEFAYFADRVLSGTPPAPNGRHGLVDMRAMDAVYRAAETGGTVEIGE